MKRSILLSFFALVLAGPVMSDVAVEDQVPRLFRIMNLDKFGDYTFFYHYATFYYNQGYREGEGLEVEITKSDTTWEAGDRFSDTYLEARDKNGNTYRADIPLGGSASHSVYKVDAVIDYVRITRVADGKIEFKVEKSKVIRKGQLNEFMPIADDNGHKGFPYLFGIHGLYLLIPLVSLAGLVMFFLFRKRITPDGSAPAV